MGPGLETIYLQTLENENRRLQTEFYKFIKPARDKKYAIGYFSVIYLFQHSFNNRNLLSKRIKDHYESCFKLGLSISEIISGIPQVINNYNKEAENYRKEHKRKIEGLKLKFKKNSMGIPIGFDGIELKIKSQKDPYFVLGPFGTVNTTTDIACELGKMMALDQFISFLKNEYVKQGGLVDNFIDPGINLNEKWQKLKLSLQTEDLEGFFSTLKTIFASLPYQLSKNESDYHNIIHTMLDIVGFEIVSELSTNTGRIDALIELEKLVYIMEFKVNSGSALNQIEKRKYHERFLAKNKKIIIIGVTISSREKNISNWTYKVINPNGKQMLH